MSALAFYIAKVYDNKSVHPYGLAEDEIFDKRLRAPCLDNTRTNTILVYPGSFNPPHRGHLQLLTHTFLHGVHDLNAIAAIITPRSDESVLRKVQSAEGTFMLGMDERSLLWEMDVAFPEWAWVYRDMTRNFSGFLKRLKQVTRQDGYDVDFVMLYGPDIGRPDAPPTGAYECGTLIMSDAARKCDFQRSNGRLRDFESCTKWQRVPVDKDQMERYARASAQEAMLRMHMQKLCYNETQSFPDVDISFVERTTLASVARATRDLERVLYCRHDYKGRSVTVRFVKAKSNSRKVKWARDISSTNVREAMRKNHGRQLQKALEEVALSPDVLWHLRHVWVDAAKNGDSKCVNFPFMYDENIDLEVVDNASIACHSSSSSRSDFIDIPFLVDGEYQMSKLSVKEMPKPSFIYSEP